MLRAGGGSQKNASSSKFFKKALSVAENCSAFKYGKLLRQVYVNTELFVIVVKKALCSSNLIKYCSCQYGRCLS